MAINQDFSTYTETDPGSDLTVTTSKITGVNYNDADVGYVYKDFTADHFDALHITFEGQIESTTDTGAVGSGVVLSTAVGEVQDVATNLSILINREVAGYRVHFFRGDAVEIQSTDYLLSTGTLYYFSLDRAAGSGTATCKVYSDSARTAQVGATLTLTGFGTTKWRYLYGINHYHQAGAKNWSGFIQNLSTTFEYNFLDFIISNDSRTGNKGVTLNFLDSVSSSDSKTQKLSFGKIYLDTLTLQDLLSLAKDYTKTPADTISLNDFMAKVARLSKTFPETLTLQEIFNRILISSRSFIDTSIMSDIIFKNLTKTFKEDVTLSDAIELLKKLNKLFEDSITLSDRIQKSLTKEYLDTITLVDILSKVTVLSVSPKDTITLNEKEFSITYTDRDVIEISADPQIQAGTHGQFLSLQYVTDYPKLRWVDGRGLRLFKGKAFTMNSGSIINFIYDSANQVWNETSRMQDIYTLQGEG